MICRWRWYWHRNRRFISWRLPYRFLNSVSRNENKVSLSLSRNNNIDVCSVWSQHGDFRVTVTSRIPYRHSPPHLAVSIILWSVFTSDVAILKTTGQCTSAVVKVPESLCKFVENFAIQVCPSRRCCDTCRSLFWQFVECDLSHRASPWAGDAELSACTALDRFQRPVTGSDTGASREHLDVDTVVVCLEISDGLFGPFRTFSCTRIFQNSNSDKCSNETEC